MHLNRKDDEPENFFAFPNPIRTDSPQHGSPTETPISEWIGPFIVLRWGGESTRESFTTKPDKNAKCPQQPEDKTPNGKCDPSTPL